MISKLIHELAAALSNCPESTQDQQKHFAVTIPELREKLSKALTDEFNAHELEVLRDELGSAACLDCVDMSIHEQRECTTCYPTI